MSRKANTSLQYSARNVEAMLMLTQSLSLKSHEGEVPTADSIGDKTKLQSRLEVARLCASRLQRAGVQSSHGKDSSVVISQGETQDQAIEIGLAAATGSNDSFGKHGGKRSSKRASLSQASQSSDASSIHGSAPLHSQLFVWLRNVVMALNIPQRVLGRPHLAQASNSIELGSPTRLGYSAEMGQTSFSKVSENGLHPSE